MIPAIERSPPASEITQSVASTATWSPFSAASVPARPLPIVSVSPAIRSASNTCSGRPRSIVKKLVTSTSRLIGLSPIERSRACSHSGLGPFATPRTVRPSTHGHASRSVISQRSGEGNRPSTGPGAQSRSVPSPAAARSRATPRTLSASPRFGVTAISITGSSIPAQAA